MYEGRITNLGCLSSIHVNSFIHLSGVYVDSFGILRLSLKGHNYWLHDVIFPVAFSCHFQTTEVAARPFIR